jgi:L-aminopeptidase/D-esterase-like protein
VTEASAVLALEAAASGPIELGSVGGGTGMNCYEFKGGSGSASRVVEYGGTEYTVGAFLQTNFGARPELRIAGVPFGELLADDNPMTEAFAAPPGAGSCIGIVLTDAPLLPDQCEALARRVTLGLARTGTAGSVFSGDLFLAESVGNPGAITPGFEALLDPGSAGRLDALRFIPWGFMDPFYAAVVQATEEAVIDSLVANEEVTGFRGHRTPALPRDRVVRELQRRGVIA